MTQPVSLHWFRQDLRLSDNLSLRHAVAQGTVLPIYILDDDAAAAWAMGGASRWWLHHSLTALNASLGGALAVYRGDARDILPGVAARMKVAHVSWNRCYEPWRMARDAEIKTRLSDAGIEATSFNGSLLWEPWEIRKKDGTPYKVFTPFYRKGCLVAPPPRGPVAPPAGASYAQDHESLTIADLDLLPSIRWDTPLAAHWDIGEKGAAARFQTFLQTGLKDYKDGRNFPNEPLVSRLSPHLHFGEISVNTLWHGARAVGGDGPNVDTFWSELGWREFCHSQLYYNHDLPEQPLQRKFAPFPWAEDTGALGAWQRGQTGIPMVDAGLRELWQTGYMHNRVRMIVGSFLVKNLRLDWRHGQRWFWECLVDADLANNAAGWQWIAGCGADAAPYFRIFNPVTQGQKFDPTGAYIRRYVPEIAALPDRYLYAPWEAPHAVLRAAGLRLGETYPRPIVDLKHSREAALAAFKSL